MSSQGNLPKYLATATLSRSATEALGPALLIVAIAVLGDPATGSYLVAALTGAAAIGGPVVGALLDRTSHPRRAFRSAMISLTVGVAAIALLIGHASLPMLMCLAAVTGLAFPALTGAWTAQIPALVPSTSLPRAYSADAGTYSVASIIGPPAAAALLVVSATAPLWMPVALLLIAIGLISFVPLAPRPKRREHSLISDLRHGAATIVKRPALRRTTLITTISFMGQAAVFICSPLIAQRLTGSLAFTGVILGALAVGGVISAGFLLRFPIRRPDATVIVATVVMAFCLAGFGLANSVPAVLIWAFIIGLAEIPQLSSIFLVRNREAPVRVRSQVFTTGASLRTSAFAVGSAVFGSLLVYGTTFVILCGVGLHVVALAIGLAAGPPITRQRLRPTSTPTLAP